MRELHFLKNIKIQKQLFSRVFLVLSFPILILGFLLIVGSAKHMTNQFQELANQENARVRSVLFDLTTNIYNHSEDFVMNEELNALIYRDYENTAEMHKYMDSFTDISSLLAKDASLSEIKIYTKNSKIKNQKYFYYCDEETRNSEWYKLLATSKSSLWRTEEAPVNSPYPYQLCLYRVLPLPLQNDFAIMKFTVSNNYLKIRLENHNVPSILTVNNSPAFYNDGTILAAEEMPYNNYNTEPYYQNSGVQVFHGSKCMTSVSTLVPYRSDDCIYILSYSSDSCDYVRHQTYIYMAIVGVALLIPCVLLYIYTCYFSERIAVLKETMHQATTGDYDIIISNRGDDEITEIFQDMLTLVESIKQQEQSVYQSKIREQILINHQQELENQQQQIEYRILASQINPHFLYNTLESIRMKAINEDNPEIAKAIKLLGRYLHYSLESIGKSTTSLLDELDYVEMYLAIQKMRFKNRVNYQICVDMDIEPAHYQILPFILQPIVENSVLHGLEGKTGEGMIIIQVHGKEDKLVVTVKDNGGGIQPEKLEELNARLKSREITYGKSIGLANINHRIQLRYGRSYGVSVYSKSGEGTEVTILQPMLTM